MQSIRMSISKDALRDWMAKEMNVIATSKLQMVEAYSWAMVFSTGITLCLTYKIRRSESQRTKRCFHTKTCSKTYLSWMPMTQCSIKPS